MSIGVAPCDEAAGDDAGRPLYELIQQTADIRMRVVAKSRMRFADCAACCRWPPIKG